MLGLGDYDSSGDEEVSKAQDRAKAVGNSAKFISNDVSCVLKQSAVYLTLQIAHTLVLIAFSGYSQ